MEVSSQSEVPSPPQSESLEQSWLQDLERVDRLMEEQDAKNQKYRYRALFLIPFNAFCIFATIKYFKNIQKTAKRFWPNRQKATLLNLFVVGTAQAIFFTTFYIGGSLAILGINPVAVIKRREQLIGGPTDEELQADENQMNEAVKGMSMSDAIVLRMFKAMGLQEKTMIMIEKDLRQQQEQAQNEVEAAEALKREAGSAK